MSDGRWTVCVRVASLVKALQWGVCSSGEAERQVQLVFWLKFLVVFRSSRALDSSLL